jgi:hypothetical protein
LKVSHQRAYKGITLTFAAETRREAGRGQEEEEGGDGEEESRQGQAKRYGISDFGRKCIMNGVVSGVLALSGPYTVKWSRR